MDRLPVHLSFKVSPVGKTQHVKITKQLLGKSACALMRLKGNLIPFSLLTKAHSPEVILKLSEEN